MSPNPSYLASTCPSESQLKTKRRVGRRQLSILCSLHVSSLHYLRSTFPALLASLLLSRRLWTTDDEPHSSLDDLKVLVLIFTPFRECTPSSTSMKKNPLCFKAFLKFFRKGLGCSSFRNAWIALANSDFLEESCVKILTLGFTCNKSGSSSPSSSNAQFHHSPFQIPLKEANL